MNLDGLFGKILLSIDQVFLLFTKPRRMKTLLIVRHANSGPTSPGQSDFDRPLSKRGKEDAEAMAKRIARKIDKIDLFIASAALRTRETAVKIMQEFEVDEGLLQTEKQLYECSPEEYYNILEDIEDGHQVVAVIGHNPGISSFVDSLKGASVFDMPAGAVFALNFDGDKWSDIRRSEKNMIFFFYPEEAGY